VEKGLRLATAIWRYWLIRGALSDGRRLIRGILSRVQELDSKPGESLLAKAYSAAGAISWAMGEYDASDDFHQEALRLRRSIGDVIGVSSSLSNLAINACARQDYASAIQLLQEAADGFRNAGDHSRLAHILDNLAAAYLDSDDPAAARAPLQESLSFYEKTGDLWGKAIALQNLAQICLREGDLKCAHTYIRESLDIRLRLKDTGGIMAGLIHQGEVLRQVGFLEDVARLYSAVLSLSASSEQPFSPSLQSQIQKTLASLRASLGAETFSQEWERGARLPLDEALSIVTRPLPDSVWKRSAENQSE
jgi:tetratricopeptide (TPR) repeat protein